MRMEDLKIAVYADGADIKKMKEEYEKGYVKGFTTNPTLMKEAGIKNYITFARDVIKEIPDLPISLEVFADDFETMEKEARIISALGENVYVKIPVTNSKKESSAPLIRKLSQDGLKLNVTAVFTLKQVKEVVDAFALHTDNIVSIFSGRISDAGENATIIMESAVKICHKKSGVRALWASCREIYNIIQAEQCGADIVTVTEDILKKLPNLGKDLEDFSLETIQMFVRDGQSLGFSII